MERDLLVGIDAGTSVIKSVVFTHKGEQVAMAARPNSYSTPGPGQVEQDMIRTWSDCAATLRELHDTIPNLASRVAAVAVTGQGDGTWLIDREGEPVGGALLWLDSRAAGLIAPYMQSDKYRKHYKMTGSGLNACMASGQLAWLQIHQPERIARATTTLHCKDWLYFKLTGERVTDPSESSFTFGNFRTRQYEPDILDQMGIAGCARLLPPIIEGTQVSHGLSAAASSVTGLPVGLPVVLAYLDVVCTGLGGGAFDRSGKVGLTITGTTGMHMRYAPTIEAVKLNTSLSGYTMCFRSSGPRWRSSPTWPRRSISTGSSTWPGRRRPRPASKPAAPNCFRAWTSGSSTPLRPRRSTTPISLRQASAAPSSTPMPGRNSPAYPPRPRSPA
jgi:erythritol kinase